MSPPEVRTCTAHSKRTGQPCRAKVTPGHKVCRMHGRDGGRPPIRGRYVEKLPQRLADAYDRAVADPKLLDLADGIAAMDAIVQERAAMVAQNDSVGWRLSLERLAAEAREARGSAEEVHALNALLDHVDAGADAARAQTEFFGLRERLSVRVEEVWRLRLARGSAVNARDLAKLFTALLGTIQRVLTESGVPVAVQRRLSSELLRLAVGDNATPTDFRAELSVSAVEVQGART